MNFKDFKHIVLNTRCTRRFKSDIKIDKSELEELVDVARQVSSAKNLQPLRYIIITDESIKHKVYKPLVWASNLPNWSPKDSEKPSAYILVLNDSSIDGFSEVDSGIAMQTIVLGAKTKGISSCIMASIDKEEYQKIFKLKKDIKPIFIIALGIADETVKLKDVKNNITNYYRDKNDNHIVPKRVFKDIVLSEKPLEKENI